VTVITIIITITHLKPTCTQIVIYKVQVAHRGESRITYRVSVDNLRERDHLENLDIGERIILKWIFKKLA
jgi:hypothetical protein